MPNPTFGYLGSLTPAKDTKQVLHVADAGDLVEGKLYVTHKNPYPVRVRVGVSDGDISAFNTSSYFIYDWIIEEGKSYESDLIYYSNNQSLVVSSDSDNTAFIIQGQMTTDPTPSGFVNSLKTDPININQVLYTVPTGEEAIISVFVTNQGPTPARFRLGISSENAGSTLTSDEYIEYNQDLIPRDTYQRTAIKVRGDQSVVVRSDNPNICIACYAKFNYTSISTDLSLAGDLTIGKDASIGQNLTVTGTLTQTDTASFNSDVTVGGDLDITGTIQGLDSGQVQKYTLANDTGNFITGGTVSAAAGLSTGGNLTIGSNKFTVDATTGDTVVAGALTLSAGFSSNLDLLNNKVINLAEPTALTDAATRRYVDSKIAAFSIALG